MKLTDGNRQAIAAAQNQGMQVTLATGRSFHSALNYAEQLAIDLPLICANGAIIIDRGGNVLREAPLPAPITAPLLHEMLDAGLFVQAYHRHGMYTAGPQPSIIQWIRAICDNKLKPSHILYALREYRRCAIRYNDKLPYLLAQGQVEVHKLFCSGTHAQQDEFRRRAQELGLTVEFYPGQGERMYLEIMAAQVSKGNALKILARHIGVALAETVAIGDNLNDLSMMEAAGLGVAMGNGHPQLQQAAHRLTLSNDEDGVAALINLEILAPASDRPAI